MANKQLSAILSRLSLLLLLTTLIIACDANAQETNQRIMFLSDHEGSTAIYTMQADGTDIQQFTDVIFEEGGEITGASLSPDGAMLAVSSRKERNLDYFSNEIFLLDLATGDVTMLTNDNRNNSSPAWSPDSQYLAYLTGSGINGFSVVNIFAIPTQTTSTFNSFDMAIRWFDWSPDGSQLALAGQTPLPDAFNVMIIMNADGTTAHQVTPDELSVGLVSWENNPDLIYTVCYVDDVGDICRLNLRTLEIEQLSNHGVVFPDEGNSYVSSMDVSHSGEIIFTYGETNLDIYNYNIADGSVTLVSPAIGDNYELIGWVDIPVDDED